MRLGCSGRQCITISKVFVDLVSDCSELTPFELADANAAPAFGGANERGVNELQDGALAKGMRDHFGAPARLAEQALEDEFSLAAGMIKARR